MAETTAVQGVTIGVLVAYAIGMGVAWRPLALIGKFPATQSPFSNTQSCVPNTRQHWPPAPELTSLAGAAIPAGLAVLSIFFPASPRWLFAKGREEAGK